MLVIILMITSCSTQKNTFPNRAYHTVTSKFNVNFNGKEALKSGETELAKKNKDNYTALLPIYYYPAKEDLASIFPSMDKAIEKASKSIYKHSMLIRGKEYVKTMDDAYMIMGKAYFYKQDYVQAQRIFSYITNSYKGSGWNCEDEALILGVRAALRQNYYSRAQALLNEAQYAIYDQKSKKLNVLFSAAAAEYQLTAPDGDVLTAIDYIQDAIANNPDKEFKTRLYFILGQLYESLQQFPEAQKNFAKVIKSSPAYDMEFSAQMHLANNYDGTPDSKNTILKEMKRMLDEKKNEDYKDQIYFAISEIYRIDKEKEEQMKNLALSVSHYTNNDYQRTYSAITLADIYFEDELYIESQAYYDTALLSLPKNYPNYAMIVKKANTLKGLVENLQIVMLQDSLQRIAKLNDSQRSSWVNQMISKFTENERRAAQEEAARMLALQSTAGMSNINSTSSNGKWYFYNQALVTAGKNEFYTRWGNRKLEDNWRVSNKQQLSIEDMSVLNDPSLEKDSTEYDDAGNPIKKRETDPKKAEYYTQDLPLTQEAIDSSNLKIANALYNAAIIYMDQLNDIRRSNETFEKLITRFPDDKLALPSYYILYLNYLHANNPKFETPKNIILTKYPDTDFAKLILDPDYYEKIAEKNKELEIKYEAVFQTYQQKQWSRTIQLANEAIPLCNDKNLKAKYEYIRAVAIGQTFGEDSLRKKLNYIIREYPKTQIEDLARTYLSMLSTPANTPQLSDSASVANNAGQGGVLNGPFQYKPNELHYVVVLIDVSKYAVLDIKNDINAFNKEFFRLQNFNMNSFYINQNEQMITIARFKNKETSMEYYNSISKNIKFASKIGDASIKIYPMSATNYTTYYNKVDQRSFYKEFFETYYLK
jgi:tetratricopeptide (TPR) repeat protein